MKIQLYKNNSKKNILDKTSFLEEITTLDGTYVDCSAYLGSDYKVVIDVSNATLSDYSVHGEYIEY